MAASAAVKIRNLYGDDDPLRKNGVERSGNSDRDARAAGRQILRETVEGWLSYHKNNVGHGKDG